MAARARASDAEFVVGAIADVELDPAPEVVLALHACDTATDEALARAVGWEAALVLAAPCCHHDIAAQLRTRADPGAVRRLTRDGILRERLADTLTDALRASLLRLQGYRVDVVQFVESQHTPRNTLLRAVRTGRAGRGRRSAQEYDDLVATWRLPPRLAELLGGRVPPRVSAVRRRRVAAVVVLRSCSAWPPARRPHGAAVAFRFTDPAIVESSGLVVARRAGHHGQRLRRRRPGLRRRPGHRRHGRA